MFSDDISPPKKKKIWPKIAIFLIVLAALGGTGFVLSMKIKFADFKPPSAPANVIVTTVSPIPFDDKIQAIGTVQADESTNLTATVTETVKSISVGEGQFVKAGTVLVELTDDEEQANLDEATRAYIRHNKLTNSKLGSVADRDEAKARMDVARAQLSERQIVAPFDGVTGLRQVSIGDLVSPGTLVTTIDDIDPVKADFSVPEAYLPALRNGMVIKARTVAYPDTEFEGSIYAIDSRVDPDTRALQARAVISNEDHRLRPGMLLSITIVKASRSSLALPEEAILSSGEQTSVYVVIAENKIENRSVTIGLREPGYVEILSGLKEGDKVVIEGQMKTGPGTTVNVVEDRSLDDAQSSALKFAIPRKKDAIEQSEKQQEQKAE